MAEDLVYGPALTDDQKASRVLSRLSAMKNIRSPWEDMWDQITEFVFPRRTWEGIGTTEGSMYGKSIYDGSPGAAASMLADGMQGYLVSPAIKWFSMRYELPAVEELPGMRKWLQDVEEHFYGIFRRTNFYHVMAEYFLDSSTLGTATMYTEEDAEKGEPAFSCRHPYEVYIAENRFGYVDTVFREFEMSARQIIQSFAEIDGATVKPGKVPENILQVARTSPETRMTVVHAVFPRDDTWIRLEAPSSMNFGSLYVLPGSDQKGSRLIREKGYRLNPYHVWRWRKNSQETYGRSPCADALYDIKMLNAMGRTTLLVAQRAAEPAYNVPEDMRGQVRVGPLGMNYYEDPSRIVAPIASAINYPVTIDQVERLQKVIENHFHTDLFLLLSRAEKPMTAREVVEKQGEKAAILGTVIGRLDAECLNPLFERIFDLEWNAGRLPQVPPALAGLQGTRIRIEYNGPLAQAQRRLFESQGTIQALESGLPLAQFDPSVLDQVKLDLAFRKIVESLGIDESTLRDPAEVAMRKMMREMAAAEAQRMAQAEAYGKAVPGLNQVPVPGSPLEQIQEQQRMTSARRNRGAP